MKNISATAMVRREIKAVWEALSRPEGLQALSESFAGWGASFRYAVENGAPLGNGAILSVSTPGGSPLMRWQVCAWEPPGSFELVANQSRGILWTYHMLVTFTLNSIDSDLTEVSVSVRIIFLNPALEILSLILPVRFLYARRLKRALRALRSMT